MPRPEKILLTGVTGTVGSELARLFIERTQPACVLVRSESDAARFRNQGLEARIGDFNRPAGLPGALAGIDKIYLVYPDRADRQSAERNLIDAARQAGVKHIVKQSAYAASLTPPVSFGIALAQTDRYLTESGLNWTLLRPYAFMQNLLAVAGPVVQRGILPMPFGTARVAFIDCRDIAEVAFHALTEPGHQHKTYYLSGPRAVTLREVAQLMSGLLERKIRYISPPFWLARRGLKQQMSEHEIALFKPLLRMIRHGGEERVFSAVDKVCGHAPRDIETFFRDHLAAFSRS